MRETLLLDVPYRQVVFTIPKMLRLFFKFKRRLLGDLCRCAVRPLLSLERLSLLAREGKAGYLFFARGGTILALMGFDLRQHGKRKLLYR